jgi:hypothetical protein
VSEPLFRRRRWWRTGACGTCGADPALVTWVGALRDESRPTTHRHVFVCDRCVGSYDQPEPEPDAGEPEPEPVPLLPPLSLPEPLAPRGERWLHVANTALSMLSVILAAAALLIARGPN